MPRSRAASFRAKTKPLPEEFNLSDAQIRSLDSQLSGKDFQSSHMIQLDGDGGEKAFVLAAPSMKHTDKFACFLLREDLTLGEGSGGRVFKAVNMATKKVVACKVTCRSEFDDVAIIEAEQEVHQMLGTLKGKGQLKSDRDDGDGCTYFDEYTFMELYSGVSLEEHIYKEEGSLKNTDLSFTELCPIVFAAIHQMLAFHKINLIMRDIKPDNFLIKKSKGKIKLPFVDVGSVLSRDVAASSTLLDGTSPGYEPPELLAEDKAEGLGFGPQTDIYSMGMMLAEILSIHPYLAHTQSQIEANQLPGGSRTPLTQVQLEAGMPDIFGQLPPIQSLPMKADAKAKNQLEADKLRREIIDLIKQMVNPDPDARINSEELKRQTKDLEASFGTYQRSRRRVEKPRRSFQSLRGAQRITPLGRGGTFGAESSLAGKPISHAEASAADTQDEDDEDVTGNYVRLDSVRDRLYRFYSSTPGSASASTPQPDSPKSSAGLAAPKPPTATEVDALADQFEQVSLADAEPLPVTNHFDQRRGAHGRQIATLQDQVQHVIQSLATGNVLPPRSSIDHQLLLNLLEQSIGPIGPSEATMTQARRFIEQHQDTFPRALPALVQLEATLSPAQQVLTADRPRP